MNEEDYKTLIEALEWYANANHWREERSVHQNTLGARIGPSLAEKDAGGRAKAALAETCGVVMHRATAMHPTPAEARQ